MEKLLKKKETLELEKELLQAGMLDREEVATSRAQTRMSVLGNLVKRIQRNAEATVRQRQKFEAKLTKEKGKAFEKGQRAEQKAIRSMQDQLIQIINAATQDRGFRQRLRNMVNKVTNRKQFNTAARKLQKELKRLERKKADAEYQAVRQKVLNQIEKMIKDRVKHKRGFPTATTIDADTVKRFKMFREFLKDQVAAEDAIIDFNTEFADELSQRQMHLIPDNKLEEFKIATMALGLADKDLLTLNIIAADVAQWLEDGRQEVLDKKEALKEQRDEERSIANTSIGVDPDEVRKPRSKSKRKENLVKQLKSSTLTWNVLMDWLSRKDLKHELTQLTDLTEARDTYLAGKEISTLVFKEKLQDALKEIGSTINLADKIYQDSHTTMEFDFINQTEKLYLLKLIKLKLLKRG